MPIIRRIHVRHDSKSIALLSVFSAMVAALEIFPIVGITDLKLVPEVPSFTIDWTGIPIIFVLYGLGLVYSFVSIGIMGIAIGYRNPIGATFKVTAEALTVLGFFLGRAIIPNRFRSERVRIVSGLIVGAVFRAIGMLGVNALLLPVAYGLPVDLAVHIGIILIPWNILQATINIIGGLILFRAIPEDLALQAGLGEGQSIEEMQIRELEQDDSSETMPD
ncbi:MAG: hypothetical protein K9W43_11410 [Candidatus Thorarchaeota archaeon]|nr:hypothetical protein [Candidatus Thorarchaeota archaeon]